MKAIGSRNTLCKAGMTGASGRRITNSLGVALSLVVAAAAGAQDGPTRQLTFGIDQRLETSSNQALETPSKGSTSLSTTRLSFGFLSETAVDRFAVTGSGTLRIGDGPGVDSNGFTFDDRRLGLSYSHTAAIGEVQLNASLRDANIRFLRPLEDFLNADTGEIELPEDLEDLEGDGTRRSTALSGSLRLGDQSRLGVTLRAGLSRIDYANTTAAGLADSERLSYGADFRLTLNDVTTATLGLSHQDFTSDSTVGTRRTNTLSLGVSREFVNGAGNITLSVADKPGNIRTTNLSFGRSFETADSSFAFTLGVSGGNGNTDMIGSVRYARELARGSVNLRISRGVTTSSDDTDRLSTLISAGYTHEIGPNSTLGLTASWAESLTPATNAATTNSTVGITYSQALTEDWALNTGITHRSRDTSTAPAADSNTLFIGLSRSWN